MEYNIEFIIDEIATIIKDNLLLFLFNDSSLKDLKEYCKKDFRYKYTPHEDLIYFVKEALFELINKDYLYDFRDIE